MNFKPINLQRSDKLRELTLMQYVKRYMCSRDVTKKYADITTARVKHFVMFLGRDPMISELTCDLVNLWLATFAESALSKVTVSNYRRAMMAIMQSAYMECANEEPPSRLRKIKVKRRIVESFSLREIRNLLQVAKHLPGYFPNGVKRSDFWQGMIHAAYSTGLRRGDLLAVKRSQIDEHGVASVLQSKTGHIVTVCFSPEARKYISRMAGFGGDSAPVAVPRQRHAASIPSAVRAADVRPGQFRWLRRSAGSHAEAERRGDGHVLLGHRSEAVFRDHYEDQSITRCDPIKPPPIGLED